MDAEVIKNAKRFGKRLFQANEKSSFWKNHDTKLVLTKARGCYLVSRLNYDTTKCF